MPTNADIAAHYSHGHLLDRLQAMLCADGADPAHPTIEALAPYDHFHGRGVEATADAAALMPARAGDHLLDVGSGLGGPARWIARHFDCRVTGIDLTPAFCAAARHLNTRLGCDERVRFEVADALTLPFPDASFDGAYSMNVSMNIADKAALYRELGRVLKPGGWLLLSEMARGAGPEPDYPMPYAATPDAAFLVTPEQTRAGLAAAGFDVLVLHDTRDKALDYGARSRAAVARGEPPPHRAVMLVHGDGAGAMMANSARALAEDRFVPIELLARRRAT